MRAQELLVRCALVAAIVFSVSRSGDASTILITDQSSNTVVKFDGTTGAYQGIFASGGGINAPSGIAQGPDGNIYVSGNFSNTVVKYDGQTGAVLGTFVPASVGLKNPTGVLFSPSGDLYVASPGNLSVYVFDGTTGALKRPVTSSLFGRANDLAIGPDGFIYVTGTANDTILRINPTTFSVTRLFNPALGGLDEPAGLTFTSDGRLIVGSATTSKLYSYDATTGAFLGLFGSSPLVSAITDVIVRPDNSVLALGQASVNVGHFDSSGAYTGDLVASGAGSMSNPASMIEVPEPAAMSLLAVGGVSLLHRRKNR